MKKSTVCGRGICPDCGASIGSALTSWKRHRLTCKSKKKPDKKKVEKEYWFCKIGPINRKKLGWGADGPLRSAVQDKFIEMFGKQADVCSSGWGLTEEMKSRLDIISLLPITDPETLIKIDKLLSKRNKS